MGSSISTVEVADETTNQTETDTSTSTKAEQAVKCSKKPSKGIMSLNLNRWLCKMVFVVNMDLNMGKGKQCAQCAHAALSLYLKIQESSDKKAKSMLTDWIRTGQKKIVVKGKDSEQLLQLRKHAREFKVPQSLISDAGCTQIAPGSKTVLAIFGSNEELDKITGQLKLL